MRTSAYFVFIVGCFMPLGLQATVALQPHRAYYTVSMAGHPDPRSTMTDVRGTMMIELNRVEDGWTVQQRSEMWRYYQDDTVEHVRWGYVTFEATDASLLKFNTFRKVNDELTESIQGVARKKGAAIEVVYQKPDKKTLPLPEGTLFPIQHTMALLKAAEAGDQIFPRIVFDGSTAEGASEINTFISAKKVMAGNPNAEDAHQLAHQPFWPVRFAVYGLEKTEYEPEYVTTQDLLPNGIIKQYIIIDDSGVKIHGVLERIELLPESAV